MHVSAVWEHLLKNAERQFSERKIGKNSHHVFCHVTTLRAQNDVRDVALKASLVSSTKHSTDNFCDKNWKSAGGREASWFRNSTGTPAGVVVLNRLGRFCAETGLSEEEDEKKNPAFKPTKGWVFYFCCGSRKAGNTKRRAVKYITFWTHWSKNGITTKPVRGAVTVRW